MFGTAINPAPPQMLPEAADAMHLLCGLLKGRDHLETVQLTQCTACFK